jgi:murein L,D-transpeptidase YafK
MPFWQMLKAGSDAFQAIEQPPRVAICARRYIFNPVVDGDLDPGGPCPASVESATVSAATPPSRTASTTAAPIKTGAVAYHGDETQQISASLRGLY